MTPRDFLTNPHGFGRDPGAQVVVPPGGDLVSARVAYQQHTLALTIRQADRHLHISTAVVAATFGISRATYNRFLNGESWARQTGTTAMLFALAHCQRQQRRDSPST